ncbi:hypothetical protein C8J57DRAFT_1240551 [Mycena rebaudengoi]|nr:hypothetical protein C8J57DRAFT_1240551 [Mycena rebaudengoi]
MPTDAGPLNLAKTNFNTPANSIIMQLMTRLRSVLGIPAQSRRAALVGIGHPRPQPAPGSLFRVPAGLVLVMRIFPANQEPQDPGWAGKAVVHVITKKTRANRKVKASEEGPSVGIRSTGEAEDADAEIVVADDTVGYLLELLNMLLLQTASRAQGKAEAKYSIRGRISELDSRTLTLEKAIATAKLERQDLQTRLDAYKYPILTLPTEITSEIFVHFLPPYPERPPATGLTSPELLAQICQAWREIALSTPRLWRAIKLTLPTTSPTRALDLLRTWVSRSKNCPLPISLQCSTRLLEVDFIQAIIPYSERWEHIDLKLPIESLQLIGADFPLLRSLTLGPTHYVGETDSLDAIFSCPSNTFGPSDIQLPWSQLTSISAYALAASECTEILGHAAALREFRCHYVDDAARNPLPVAPLRYLQSLKVEAGFGQQQFLDSLATPVLQHITISDSLDGAIPNISALISRPHCTLTSLRILYTRKPEAYYRAGFPLIPTITVTERGLS